MQSNKLDTKRTEPATTPESNAKEAVKSANVDKTTPVTDAENNAEPTAHSAKTDIKATAEVDKDAVTQNKKEEVKSSEKVDDPEKKEE